MLPHANTSLVGLTLAVRLRYVDWLVEAGASEGSIKFSPLASEPVIAT